MTIAVLLTKIEQLAAQPDCNRFGEELARLLAHPELRQSMQIVAARVSALVRHPLPQAQLAQACDVLMQVRALGPVFDEFRIGRIKGDNRFRFAGPLLTYTRSTASTVIQTLFGPGHQGVRSAHQLAPHIDITKLGDYVFFGSHKVDETETDCAGDTFFKAMFCSATSPFRLISFENQVYQLFTRDEVLAAGKDARLPRYRQAYLQKLQVGERTVLRMPEFDDVQPLLNLANTRINDDYRVGADSSVIDLASRRAKADKNTDKEA